MKNLTYIFYIFITLAIASCNKDNEGFVQLKDLNEFGLTFPKDTTFTVFQLDTLSIDPEFQGLEGPSSRYEYEWTLYSSAQKSIVLSNEKALNEPIGAAPGNHYIQYVIKDTQTGVKSFNRFNIVVNGAFFEGWIVANNVGNQGRLSFIRIDNEIFLNPLEEINHKVYPGKVSHISSGVYSGMGSYRQILYFSEDGLTRFEANTFVQAAETNNDFFSKMSFPNKSSFGMNGLTFDQYLVSDGDVYMRGGPIFGDEFEMGPWSGKIEGDHDLFPYVFSPGGSNYSNAFFYDNKNKRFIYGAYNMREVHPSTLSNDNYSLNNIGKSMIASDYTISNNFYSIMKEDSDYYIYAFNLSSNFANGYFHKLNNSPNISQITAFASSTRYQHAYYLAENKIYKIDALANTTSLVYEMPLGLELVDMKMYKKTLRYIQTAPDAEDHNKLLVVAGNRGDAGEVYYIYLDDLGNHDSNRPVRKYEGFGKINQIEYRNPT